MKAVKRSIVSFLLRGYCLITRRRRTNVKNLDKLTPHAVVIFSTTALGDYLMNTPAISALKSRFPDAEFTLISSHKNLQMVKGYDWYHQVIPWDNKIMHIIPLIRALRRSRPELCVILHSHYPYDILAAVLSGCDVIFRDCYAKDGAHFNRYLDAWSGEFDGHTIARKLKLIEGLGCRQASPEMHLPAVCRVSHAENKRVRVGFQLGASRDVRRWPVEQFSRLAELLLTYYPQMQLITTGSPAEKVLETAFLERLPEKYHSAVECYAGKTELNDLMALVLSLDLLVTGDTGPMHIAIAGKIKTVSLFATASPDFSGPYQDNDRHCIIHQPPKENRGHPMAGITPEIVFSAIRESLSTVRQ